ncbi:MAG: hypothetical protein ACRCXZ_05605 [Patescibacteria group bacterium]
MNPQEIASLANYLLEEELITTDEANTMNTLVFPDFYALLAHIDLDLDISPSRIDFDKYLTNN